METRLILAYSIIALLVAFAVIGIILISRVRRKKHLINIGRGRHNQKNI